MVAALNQGLKKLVATTINFMSEIILESVITCPACGHSKEETMPTDACQYFYECENCKTILKPLAGDCCVYCSYGTVACPPIQMNKSCCAQVLRSVPRNTAGQAIK